MAEPIYTSPLEENQIRIARLEAGLPNDPIKCYLIHTKLDDQVSYQALSYEWKTDGGYASIFCNDVALVVTRNLLDALGSLRQQDGDRWLWVDAICINQSDIQERSLQVQMMTDIFASAPSVIAWLGPSFQGSSEAFDMFPYLAQLKFERDPSGGPGGGLSIPYHDCAIRERPREGSTLRNNQSSLAANPDGEYTGTYLSDDQVFRFDDDEFWEAIDRVLCSSYFFRTWIVQEIGVAKEIFIQCGTRILDYDSFGAAATGRTLLSFMRRVGKSNVQLVDFVRKSYRSALISKKNELNLGGILLGLANSTQSDPRDRVYAAKGLILPREVGQTLIPDYSKSLSQVFYDAACHIIHFDNDIPCCWENGILKSERSLIDLPTWVPEWTMPSSKHFKISKEKCFDCSPRLHEVKGRSLFIDGLLFDEVSEVFRIQSFDETVDLITGLRNWLKDRGSSLFTDYPKADINLKEVRSGNGRLQTASAEAADLLAKSDDLPGPAIDILRKLQATSLESGKTEEKIQNIDVVWLVLSADLYIFPLKETVCGYHLLLSILDCISSFKSDKQSNDLDEQCLGSYREWLGLARHLLDDPSWYQMSQDVLSWVRDRRNQVYGIEDSFFVTRKGYFGRASANDVRGGQFVAILNGAWSTLLLEKHENYFELICNAYLEGLEETSELKPGIDIQRLELR